MINAMKKTKAWESGTNMVCGKLKQGSQGRPC